jgi:hypothetical protein
MLWARGGFCCLLVLCLRFVSLIADRLICERKKHRPKCCPRVQLSIQVAASWRLVRPVPKAKACAQAAERARAPAERIALLQVSQCLILLAKYVANRQEHVAAHWDTEEHARSRLVRAALHPQKELALANLVEEGLGPVADQ